MKNHLFFICPTDHLEAILESHDEENYYFSSLANSIDFDDDLIGQINELIETKSIRKITFILSEDNKIINKALNSQKLSNIKALDSFFDKINQQKKNFHVLFQKNNIKTPILSYHLNSKTKELKDKLIHFWFSDLIEINAKIYHRKENKFKVTNPEVFYQENFILN